ncbi:hypothetical protein AaE_008099, partial [Aphanomyces astaci]
TKSVLGVLMAYLLVHYPALKDLSPDAPAVKGLEACVVDAGFSIVDLFAWSTHLANIKAAAVACSVEDDVQSTSQGRGEDERELIQQQQNGRLGSTPQFHKQGKGATADVYRGAAAEVHHRRSSTGAGHAAKKEVQLDSPHGDMVRMVSVKKSNSKLLVAFMKLFLDNGFVLDMSSSTYRDVALDIGQTAQRNLLAYLAVCGVDSKGSSAVLKHLLILHRSGDLKDRITCYRNLLAMELITDPAPQYTHDILDLYTSKN